MPHMYNYDNITNTYSSSSQYVLSTQYLYPEYLVIPIPPVASPPISCSVSALPYPSATKSVDKEKISAYECGSNPSEDARNQFDVRFYSVAISSTTSDPEASPPSPRAVTLNKITIPGSRTMFVSLFISTVGFIHEWKKGALE